MPSVTSKLRGFILSVIAARLSARPRAPAEFCTVSIMDEGLVYGACRERVGELVRHLDDAQLATAVPATPAWSVHDVVAHLVGITADVNAGNLDGIGSDPWTAAQVGARADTPIAVLLDEWSTAAPQFEAGLTAIGGLLAAGAVADIWNHEQDIRGALGVEGGRDPEAEKLAIEGYAALRAGTLDAAGLAPLRLRAGVDEYTTGEGEPGATVTTEPFEIARLLCIRRTADEARAYRWEGDAEPYVVALTADGPAAPLPA
jgi:uncharacterized protein (TIGR03083 family)